MTYHTAMCSFFGGLRAGHWPQNLGFPCKKAGQNGELTNQSAGCHRKSNSSMTEACRWGRQLVGRARKLDGEGRGEWEKKLIALF